jgi:hypothetical protein
MANKIFNDFQGNTVKIDGVCYTFIGETTSGVNATPSEVGGAFSSCLECALESSSSSSSSSSELYSESSSSSSFDPLSESSSSSADLGGGDPAPKVCGTVSGFVDPPDIILRVSNLGATETVNWAGETWNLPGDNMEEFRVCPGNYKVDTTTPYQTHYWNNGSGNPAAGLVMHRRFDASSSEYVNYIYFYWSGLGGPGVYDFKSQGTSFFDLGVINGEPLPTSNDVLITDGFFGSYTDGSNRTFTWRRGDKWPAP